MATKYKSSIDVSQEEAERLGEMQDQAVRDADEGQTMIAIRWGRPQLRLVKATPIDEHVQTAEIS